MVKKATEKNWSANEMEQLLEDRERRILDRLIQEALEPVAEEKRDALLQAVRARAELRRFEHGGHFVAVRMGDEWLPVGRAVSILEQEV
jgi:hypothetical protein